MSDRRRLSELGVIMKKRVRPTSIQTYREIRDSGLLSKRRWEVYDALYEHGPCTANELFKKWKVRSFVTQQNIHPRLGELRELGVVAELEKRRCEVTGREAYVWITTDDMPVKFEKPKLYKCTHCKGKGTFTEQQTKMF